MILFPFSRCQFINLNRGNNYFSRIYYYYVLIEIQAMFSSAWKLFTTTHTAASNRLRSSLRISLKFYANQPGISFILFFILSADSTVLILFGSVSKLTLQVSDNCQSHRKMCGSRQHSGRLSWRSGPCRASHTATGVRVQTVEKNKINKLKNRNRGGARVRENNKAKNRPEEKLPTAKSENYARNRLLNIIYNIIESGL